MKSNDGAGTTWPEQDAIDQFFDSHLSNKDKFEADDAITELKHAVTAPRLKVMEEMERLAKAQEMEIQVKALSAEYNEVNERASRIASAVCDIVWGGELGWTDKGANIDNLINVLREKCRLNFPTGYLETLIALSEGVIWDGNLISKQHRDKLVEAQMAGRWNGWNYITSEGIRTLYHLGLLKS